MSDPQYTYVVPLDYDTKPNLETVVLMNIMKQQTDKKINELKHQINDLTLKLTRLLDMVEFSPDGGPGAVEAKKLFTEHANTN